MRRILHRLSRRDDTSVAERDFIDWFAKGETARSSQMATLTNRLLRHTVAAPTSRRTASALT
jgi:hypothetical protein